MENPEIEELEQTNKWLTLGLTVLITAVVVGMATYSITSQGSGGSDEDYSAIAQYNCEKTDGTFEDGECSCPLVDDVETVYNEESGYCETAEGVRADKGTKKTESDDEAVEEEVDEVDDGLTSYTWDSYELSFDYSSEFNLLDSSSSEKLWITTAEEVPDGDSNFAWTSMRMRLDQTLEEVVDLYRKEQRSFQSIETIGNYTFTIRLPFTKPSEALMFLTT